VSSTKLASNPNFAADAAFDQALNRVAEHQGAEGPTLIGDAAPRPGRHESEGDGQSFNVFAGRYVVSAAADELAMSRAEGPGE
jgi:hypothetical protein